jgi:hypothetical protein
MNEIPEPDLILALRILGAAMLLSVFSITGCVALWSVPKLRILRERLAIWWRDYRRPLMRCRLCDKPHRTLRHAINHKCPLVTR